MPAWTENTDAQFVSRLVQLISIPVSKSIILPTRQGLLNWLLLTDDGQGRVISSSPLLQLSHEHISTFRLYLENTRPTNSYKYTHIRSVQVVFNPAKILHTGEDYELNLVKVQGLETWLILGFVGNGRTIINNLLKDGSTQLIMIEELIKLISE